MGRLLTIAGAMTVFLALPSRAEQEFDGTIDLRAVAADGLRSSLDGGLGELRFDDQHDGLRVGELRFGYRADPVPTVHFVVEAVSYADHERHPIDLTETYAELRPFPYHGWRARLKVGAFYAPISLENRMSGWRSPYSISPSAINTWVGEELRTIGAEYNLDWLGRQRGHDWELTGTAAALGWNDPAGTLLAKQGWAIHDRQTTLFGQVGETGNGPIDGVREFDWIDHRIGYYAGVSAKYLDALELRMLHYDNRADPNAFSHTLLNYAWRTNFNSAGARWIPTDHWTVIAQWLAGETCEGLDPYCWQFHAAFLLSSWQHVSDRVSVRYDTFDMHKTNAEDFYNSDTGHAWTIAYQRMLGQHWSLAVEALQIDSRLLARAAIGEPIGAVERELQVAVRYEL
jgi:hypothetical protein